MRGCVSKTYFLFLILTRLSSHWFNYIDLRVSVDINVLVLEKHDSVHFNRPLRTAWRQHTQNSEGLWDSHASRWNHMTLFMSSCVPYIRACCIPWLSAIETFLHFVPTHPFERIFVCLLAWHPLSVCCLIYSFITVLPIISFYCPPSSTRVQITPVSLWMSFPVILWLESWW